MPYYFVRLEIEGYPTPSAYIEERLPLLALTSLEPLEKLDLTREQALCGYVLPYVEGKPLFFHGVSIFPPSAPEQLWRLHIYETPEPAKEFCWKYQKDDEFERTQSVFQILTAYAPRVVDNLIVEARQALYSSIVPPKK